MFKYSMLYLILVLALPKDVTKAQADQPGFISIDCGLQGPNYTNEVSGLYYVSDAGFVASGVSGSVSDVYGNDVIQQFQTLRYFPQGSRNCYTLRPIQGKDGRYLIRARFMYGDYDGLNQPPKFDLYIGLQFWQTVIIDDNKSLFRFEIIHTPSSDYINVCLVKTNPGIPFITTLELRPLPTTLYTTVEPRGSLKLGFRVNFNGSEDFALRFKDDIYDRFWTSFTLPNTKQLNAISPVAVDNSFNPPSLVMGTALTPNASSNGRMSFTWSSNNTLVKHYIYLYFAELEVLGANQSRTFDIFLNGKMWHSDFTPKLSVTTTIYTDDKPESGNTTYEMELVKRGNSTLLPLINAAEMYRLIEFTLLETQDGDVAAMLNIKSTYNITQNWQGDPCGPQGFEWTGVNCTTNDDSDNPRITSLNLSSKKLVGPIAPAIFELKALQKLDLSNNNLSGPVPEFLAELGSLTVLNLKGNNFSLPFPQQLLDKAKSGNLKFDYDNSTSNSGDEGSGNGNTGGGDVCQSEPCNKKKKKSIVVPVGASVGGVLFVICASLLIFFFKKSKKPKAATFKLVETVDQERRFIGDPNSTPLSQISNATSPVTTATIQSFSSQNNNNKIVASKSRQFTYHEVLQITNNFQRVIGKGGFGTVYHGYVGEIQVAVKMLSPSSTQGYKEFQAEANLLITIHHKNLTSLVGYCYEGSNMGILYEYMANGSLEKHLLGKGPYVLSWEERLRMATDAAQGLEYLHHGCKPAVVHRDVKITNILVDEKFQAKLADFGLSRAFSIEDGTHVSTVVAGTPGYLDPEYYTTTRLTEKSDVYSFGIVLLEIVTGRPALARNNEMNHIITWVSSELEKGDLGNVVDPKMRGDNAVNSIWKVLEVAMSCVARNSTRRPTMNFVVMELKACLTMELTRNETDSKDSIGTISLNMDSGLNPQAR